MTDVTSNMQECWLVPKPSRTRCNSNTSKLQLYVMKQTELHLQLVRAATHKRQQHRIPLIYYCTNPKSQQQSDKHKLLQILQMARR